MNSSIKPDINGFSCYGNVGAVIGQEDIPSSAIIPSDEFPIRVYSSPLKISHSSQIVAEDLSVPQGLENALDVNVVDGLIASGKFGVGNDFKTTEGQVITIKASRDVCIGRRFNGEPSEIYGKPGRGGAHIEIGQHSDQGCRPTSFVTLRVRHAEGGPVYVVTGNVLPWTMDFGENTVWLKWASVKLAAYVYFKLLVRIVLRIPKGVKGPSWL